MENFYNSVNSRFTGQTGMPVLLSSDCEWGPGVFDCTRTCSIRQNKGRIVYEKTAMGGGRREMRHAAFRASCSQLELT
jgi:hypothetical protein